LHRDRVKTDSGWGWRIPFFIGAGLAIVALYLRRSLAETNESGHENEAGTFGELFKYWRACRQLFAGHDRLQAYEYE
jgi:hypothetical protein